MKKIYLFLDSRLAPIRQNKSFNFRELFLIASCAFFLAVITGSVFSSYLASPSYKYFLGPLSLRLDQIGSFFNSHYAVAAVIFLKNFLAVAVAIYFARRTRGIAIIILLILNGLIIGSILFQLYKAGLSGLLLLMSVMPHGIFEFLAVFVGGALGMKLLFVPERQYLSEKKKVWFWVLKTVIPLLVVAALVETNITPVLMSFAASLR